MVHLYLPVSSFPYFLYVYSVPSRDPKWKQSAHSFDRNKGICIMVERDRNNKVIGTRQEEKVPLKGKLDRGS